MPRKRIMNRKMSFDAGDEGALAGILKFIETSLRELGIDKKLVMRTVLIAEEVSSQLLDSADDGAYMRVQVRRMMGDAEVSLTIRGKEYDPYAAAPDGKDSMSDMGDEEAQMAIRSILLKSQGEKLKFSYRNGTNKVRILTGQMERSMLFLTIAALIIGIVAGVIIKAGIPEDVTEKVSTYGLVPIKTMFMNALKMVIAPVVFFSIVSCFAQFKNLAELGRIGAKVMGMYVLTTLIAVLLAIGLFKLTDPGTKGRIADTAQAAAGVEEVASEVSLIDTIVGIVPDNIVEPFLRSNTLQLVFLAVLFGIAVGLVGEYSEVLRGIFDACNSLFLTVTALISRFIPVAVFCSVILLIVQTGWDTLTSVMGMAGTYLLCILSMLIVYGLMILILGHLNPLTFYRKNKEGMLTGFTLASSAAAMPTNLRICTDKLGISPKVCNFSIPLGATVNMDGTSIILTVGGLFMAKVYGVEVTDTMLISLVVTIVMLSLGAPGVPGSGLVCLGVVLSSLGVPIEALGLIIGIYPFIDMFNTMSNTTGDVASALIVASSEKLIDKSIYNK